MKNLFSLGKSIVEIGGKYDKYFNNTLWEIRKFKDYENYKMKIKDYRGEEFIFLNIPNIS